MQEDQDQDLSLELPLQRHVKMCSVKKTYCLLFLYLCLFLVKMDSSSRYSVMCESSLCASIEIICIYTVVSPVEEFSVHHHLTCRFPHGPSELVHAVLQTRVRRMKTCSLQGLQTTAETMDRCFINSRDRVCFSYILR